MEFQSGYTNNTIDDHTLVSDMGDSSTADISQTMEAFMDPGMAMEFVELRSVLADGGDRFAVSAVAFDLQEELLWMGNQGGHLTSYYGLDLQKYTSFQVHPTCNEVRQILSVDGGILCLTSNLLQCNARTGLTLFKYSDENIVDMQTMMLIQPTHLIIGGLQPKMVEMDLTSASIVREYQLSPESDCGILRTSNRYVCAGSTSGKISLLDPKNFTVEHTLDAHSGMLSDFDVSGNYLVTCGYSKRSIDRFLMQYDLRVMRAINPIQVLVDPIFCRFMNTYTTRVIVLSQAGQFNIIDPGTVAPCIPYQVNTQGGIMTFDLASSCQALAFGDNAGVVHLFGANSEHITYNAFSNDTEFPAVVCVDSITTAGKGITEFLVTVALLRLVEALPPISVDDMITPLSTIPMPYTNEKLFSDWPPHLCRKIYRKPPLIDPDILRSMKLVQFIGYAPNPGNRLRNQVPYKIDRGGKNRQRKKSVPESPLGRGDNPFLSVPKRYRKVEMKYSKLGVEDFDFKHYNKTPFPGLEPCLPNSYCNAVVQLLNFIESLANSLRSHLCQKEFCIACEIGFLMHMLDTSKPGETCQATNFLRAFRTVPEASGLGLILSDNVDTSKVNYARLIQNWNRFILQQIHNETAAQEKESAIPPEMAHSTFVNSGKSIISDLFTTRLISTVKCRCGHEVSRNSATLLFTLLYPDCQLQGLTKPMTITFAEVLRSSMCLEQTTQAWCENCQKYQPTVQSKKVKCLPDALAINCQIETQKDFEFWKIQQELIAEVRRNQTEDEKQKQQVPPPHVPSQPKPCRYGNSCNRKDCRFSHPTRDKDNGEEVVEQFYQGDDAIAPWVPVGLCLNLDPERNLLVQELHIDDDRIPSDSSATMGYYELRGVVCEIHESKTNGSHLVSCAKVGSTYHQRKTGQMKSRWYLFNDFCVTPIDKDEVCLFNLDWKVPCILYFTRKDINKRFPSHMSNPITSSYLLEEASLITRRPQRVTFVPLQQNEMPQAGDLVGLDAEFVTVNQEEAELRSDGTRATIKPSQMSVARITCVRGQGPNEGDPFIDDYISTQDQVVDYLTKFSGIQPGDLSTSHSNKHLTTLKTSYIKLRYLVDSGVIFVGHGLKKDFRVINIVVPPEQVIDTVQLFQLPKQRMISLRFLAWHFLATNIQSETHDSIEDARTALRLYQKYEELRRVGEEYLDSQIKEMYEKGRSLKWVIPQDDNGLQLKMV